ncbi:MAG: HAMP domain-containing histidine kinase [Deltaproteobacteria bacterium]|nr:HAMP domain-containing histidine kinase [Deltaproteobacteria bacterium]
MVLQRWETGDNKKIFEELEREFESTFGELIPGIIHDFASPLNGILGRSELLGRRVEKTLERIAENGNTTNSGILEDCKKIGGDAGLLAREADRLFDLFNSVAGKFRTLKDTAVQEINLSEIVEDEVAFLWFYPDTKHDVEKHLTLERDIPVVTGVRADYSIALSAIIRHSIDSMQESESKELAVTTGYDDSHVYIRIEDTGTPIAEVQRKKMLEQWDVATEPSPQLNGQGGFCYALPILKKYDALLQIGHEAGFTVTSIRIPY